MESPTTVDEMAPPDPKYSAYHNTVRDTEPEMGYLRSDKLPRNESTETPESPDEQEDQPVEDQPTEDQPVPSGPVEGGPYPPPEQVGDDTEDDDFSDDDADVAE
jgi:hypothetical protein